MLYLSLSALFSFSFICSVIMFLSDMSGRTPLYKKYVKYRYFFPLVWYSYHVISLKFQLNFLMFIFFFFYFRAFVFFSSSISRELVNLIKKDTVVLPRIGALREVIILLFAYGLFWN